VQSSLLQQANRPKPVSGNGNVFGRLSRLPHLRPASLKLLSISIDSDSALAEFEAAFKMDPALATDLLITANSPLFGVRVAVQSIRHAVAMLGLERVRSLALTISLKSYARSNRWGDAIQTLWRHSMATAVIAEALGAADQKQVQLLYTAGLTHDVGRLALFQISPEAYLQVLSREFSGNEEFLELEKFLFECSHDDAGAFLAMAWGFPIALCDCIRFHHWDIASHAGQLFELVGVACRLADVLGFPEVQRTNVGDVHSEFQRLLPPRMRSSSLLAPEALTAAIEAQLGSFQPNSK
jgi:putative nucleotidyltransferase with HDIG domain